MTNKLQQLIELYSDFGKNNFVPVSNLNIANRQRQNVYNKILTGKTPVEQGFVVNECKGFMSMLQIILQNYRTPDDIYKKVVSMMVGAHYLTEVLMDSQGMNDVLAFQETTLKSVLKKLKETPIKAKCKMGDIKEAIKIVQENIEMFKEEMGE